MKNLTTTEIAILGTTIALELAKGKEKDEIIKTKLLVSQILSTLITLSF